MINMTGTCPFDHDPVFLLFSFCTKRKKAARGEPPFLVLNDRGPV